MNRYDIFFTCYFVIVMLFWIYMIALRLKKKVDAPVLITWLVAGSNPIGMILFFVCRTRFLQPEP